MSRIGPVVTQSVSGDGNGKPSETPTVSEGGGENSSSGQSSTTSDSVAPPGSNLSSEHGVASDPGGVQTQSVVSAAGVALSGGSSNSDQLMQSLVFSCMQNILWAGSVFNLRGVTRAEFWVIMGVASFHWCTLSWSLKLSTKSWSLC